MENTLLVFVTVIVALGSGVISGVSFEQKKTAWGFVYFILFFFMVVLLASSTIMFSENATLLNIAPSQERVYVVLKKVPDEKGAFLVLYDVNSKNERVAHFAVYPPDGYAETELPDGRTALAVAGRQVIVGDQNNAKFILPVKK